MRMPYRQRNQRTTGRHAKQRFMNLPGREEFKFLIDLLCKPSGLQISHWRSAVDRGTGGVLLEKTFRDIGKDLQADADCLGSGLLLRYLWLYDSAACDRVLEKNRRWVSQEVHKPKKSNYVGQDITVLRTENLQEVEDYLGFIVFAKALQQSKYRDAFNQVRQSQGDADCEQIISFFEEMVSLLKSYLSSPKFVTVNAEQAARERLQKKRGRTEDDELVEVEISRQVTKRIKPTLKCNKNKRRKERKKAAICIQVVVRRHQRRKKAAIVIQKYRRGHQVRTHEFKFIEANREWHKHRGSSFYKGQQKR